MKFFKITVTLIALLTQSVFAQEGPFHAGPVFKDFGNIATIKNPDVIVPKDTVLKVVYDSYKNSEVGKLTSTFNSAAAFINMHVEAGHPQENIKVAIVVHGGTSVAVTKQEFYGAKNDGAINVNIPLIKALLKEGVDIYICGQSAAFRGVTKADLIEGIKISRSAMTAHAMLQADGYALILW
ncbi:MAG: DsrE family protein [Emcibacteraceae bacterium]|nr:DsrE family protein [Emcibacteraceae bacterium]